MAVSKKIELFGRELILHRRFASDVLAVMGMNSETERQQIEVLLVGVSSALKQNWIDLKGRKRKKIESLLSPVGLSKRLAISEIVSIWNQVMELEGLDGGGEDSKKK